MVQIFAFAVAKGLVERNVAELTLATVEDEKKRQRHPAPARAGFCVSGPPLSRLPTGYLLSLYVARSSSDHRDQIMASCQ